MSFDRALRLTLLAGACRAEVGTDPARLEVLRVAGERAKPLIRAGDWDGAEAELRAVMPHGWVVPPEWTLRP